RGRQVLADVVRADRQLPVAAVDEDREAHDPGAAVVGQGVEGGTHGAAGVEHVVDEHDDPAVDAGRGEARLVRRARGAAAQVVAVHRHVEGADGHRLPLDLADELAESPRELHAAAGDAEQDDVLGTLVALDDLVGDAAQRPGDVPGGEDLASGWWVGRAGGLDEVRTHARSDLLPCLTGQVVKGCRSWGTIPPGRSGLRPGHHVDHAVAYAPALSPRSRPVTRPRPGTGRVVHLAEDDRPPA